MPKDSVQKKTVESKIFVTFTLKFLKIKHGMKVLYIGNKLSKHGLNATTIETLGPQLQDLGFEITYSSSVKNFFFRILSMLVAVSFAPKNARILIDTYSTNAFWYAYFCSQLARLLGKKYYPILHGGNLPNRLQKNPKLCQQLFGNAQLNIAPSGYLKHYFEAAGYENVVLIPNSIALSQYSFKERSVFAPKLFWVRAFAQLYHPEMAVEVLVELKKTFPDASLTMVGPDKDGSLQLTKELAEKQGVAVTFTGQLSKEAWWNLAKDHDIFLNTTHFDNTPVSVLEAMALGLAVVSTNVGGIPFLVTDKKEALLVADGAVMEMKNAIINLVENPILAKKITTEARNLVHTMDWEVVKNKWISVLNTAT